MDFCHFVCSKIYRPRFLFSKPISTPEIPKKASKPNAYSGVKVGTQNKKRKSDPFKMDNKRESAGEMASTGTLSVDNISYTKRAKSGKLKSKKKSADNNGIRISGPRKQNKHTCKT